MQTTTGSTPIRQGHLFWRHDSPSPSPPPPREKIKPFFILLLHAAVADHTLWTPQVTHLVAHHGWECLRYDRLGFGQSLLSDEYLLHGDHDDRAARAPIAHYEHPGVVIAAAGMSGRKCVIVGLSMGAGTALDVVVSLQDLKLPVEVVGVLLCSGAVSGFEEPPMPELDRSLFQRYEELVEEAGQAEGGAGGGRRRRRSEGEDESAAAALSKAAETQVRIWGDGLQGSEGRLQDPAIRGKLFQWCRDIAAREARNIGGSAIPSRELSSPPSSAAERLKKKEDVPRGLMIRTAYGKYDDKATIAAMKYVHEKVNVRFGNMDADVKEFDAAHMCNMEEPDKFNSWMLAFLDKVAI